MRFKFEDSELVVENGAMSGDQRIIEEIDRLISEETMVVSMRFGTTINIASLDGFVATAMTVESAARRLGMKITEFPPTPGDWVLVDG